LIMKCIKRTVPVFFIDFTYKCRTADNCIKGFFCPGCKPGITCNKIMEYIISNYRKFFSIQLKQKSIVTNYKFIYINLSWLFITYISSTRHKFYSLFCLLLKMIQQLMKGIYNGIKIGRTFKVTGIPVKSNLIYCTINAF